VSFATGLHRLAQVIRWIGVVLAGLMAVLAIGWLFSEKDAAGGGAMAAVFAAAGAVIYGIAWAIAWITEGFAKE